MEADGGSNHRSQSCIDDCEATLHALISAVATVVFDNHPDSQAARCLAQHMLRETERNRSCLVKCSQFGAFRCHLRSVS